jgi:UDP-galactopyranose mutase
MEYDWVIVGSGISGATAARNLAELGEKRILVLDSRNHIAGNVFDFYDSNGVLIHKYGPHIFHTKSEKIYNYLSNFTEWTSYEHKVLGTFDNLEAPIPFNFETLDKVWTGNKAELKQRLQVCFENREEVFVSQLLTSKDDLIKDFGNFVFRKVFLKYSQKQWGRDVLTLSPSILARVPVRLNYDSRYFSDKYQVIPKLGYTNMISNLLQHIEIDVQINTTFNYHIHKPAKKILFSGPIDGLNERIYGSLEYRSTKFYFQNISAINSLQTATLNYLGDEVYTRVTDIRKITSQNIDRTVLISEVAEEFVPGINEPYYPVQNTQNNALYQQYLRRTRELYVDLIPFGRLGDYKYYDMDQAVARALQLTNSLLN